MGGGGETSNYVRLINLHFLCLPPSSFVVVVFFFIFSAAQDRRRRLKRLIFFSRCRTDEPSGGSNGEGGSERDLLL